MTGKYIIFERDGLEFPVLFPNHWVNHKEIVDKLGKPISAGFFSIYSETEIYVSGKSVSMNLNSRPEDSQIIQQFYRKD